MISNLAGTDALCCLHACARDIVCGMCRVVVRVCVRSSLTDHVEDAQGHREVVARGATLRQYLSGWEDGQPGRRAAGQPGRASNAGARRPALGAWCLVLCDSAS